MTNPFGFRSRVLVFAIWFLVFFSASGLLERTQMGQWAPIVVVLLSVPLFVLCLISVIRGIRGLDALQTKIQLEAVAAIWILLHFSSRDLLEGTQMEEWARIAVALLPIPAFVLFLISVIRGIRGLDELQRKIHLEALAIAFPLGLVLLMTLGLLQRAIELNWSYAPVWVFVALFYFAGLGVAKRRYE